MPHSVTPQNMNGCPNWVKAASDNHHYQSNVELDTHRQEKENPMDSLGHVYHHTYVGEVSSAGFTCEDCPNPRRPLPSLEEGEEGLTAYTERCKPCNTKMKRWTRTRKLESRISIPVEHFGTDVFVAFVTMTIPNIPDSPERGSLPDEVRSLKRRVASFRRTKGVEDRVVGGIDAFENTERPNGDWNIHHHGIWIMSDYWSQKDFQESWGFRVRIEKVRRPHAVLKYLTSYATKEPIEGVRCLETFGVSRGAAFTAIDEYVQRQRTSNTAEPALEE